jgi:hypothetical protein
VAFKACKRVAASGLLVAMPGIAALREVKDTLKSVEDAGVGAHIGASSRVDAEVIRVDQNAHRFYALVVSAGTFLKIVAPASTLAASPTQYR